MQPWLDIKEIGSTVIAVASDEETAKKYADMLAERLYENRDEFWPDLMTVDEVIDLSLIHIYVRPVVGLSHRRAQVPVFGGEIQAEGYHGKNGGAAICAK